MMTLKRTSRYGWATIFFATTGTCIYVLMITITLAHIEELTSLKPFDMRPFGYTPQDAYDLLSLLGEDGRRYYLMRQIPLDTLYPALLAMTLISAICWFAVRMPRYPSIYIWIALSACTALFDYAENFGIALMILSWSDLSPALVFATSLASILKATVTMAASFALLFLALKWMISNRPLEARAVPNYTDPKERTQGASPCSDHPRAA